MTLRRTESWKLCHSVQHRWQCTIANSTHLDRTHKMGFVRRRKWWYVMCLVWRSCLHTSNFGFNLQGPFPLQYSVSKLPHNMETSDMDVDGGSLLVLSWFLSPLNAWNKTTSVCYRPQKMSSVNSSLIKAPCRQRSWLCRRTDANLSCFF